MSFLEDIKNAISGIGDAAKNIANSGKDSTTQLAARMFINYKLNKLNIGSMTKIEIQTDKQEVFVVLDLKGEQTPIELTIHYHVLNATQIEIKEVRSSREWIDTVVNQFLADKLKAITPHATVMLALTKLIK